MNDTSPAEKVIDVPKKDNRGGARTPGPDKALCGYSMGNGRKCIKTAGAGTDHKGYGFCFKHGGNSRNFTIAAQKIMAREAVTQYGLSKVIDPHQALLEEVYRSAGIVDFLQNKIQSMTEEELVWGKVGEELVRERLARPAEDGTGIEILPNVEALERTIKKRMTYASGVNIWLDQYDKERRHLVDVCKTAIQCGVSERLVKLAEQHNMLIAATITKTLTDLGIDSADDRVRAALRKNLLLTAAQLPAVLPAEP